MKEIFQYLSHITYHNDDMGEKEKTIVLHTTSGRTLILGKQADTYTSIKKVLAWFGLGVANKRQVYCLDLGFDLDNPNTYISLRRGKHWDDAEPDILAKAILNNQDKPTFLYKFVSDLKTALHPSACSNL